MIIQVQRYTDLLTNAIVKNNYFLPDNSFVKVKKDRNRRQIYRYFRIFALKKDEILSMYSLLAFLAFCRLRS